MSPAPTIDLRQEAQPSSTRVNLGPLTTTFVAPSHCSRDALACPTCTGATRAQSCRVKASTATAEDDTGCWPRATAYPRGGAAPLLGMGFYSPGIMCPMGFTSACTAISTTQGQKTLAPKVTGEFQFPLEAGETAVGCCPTGYSCALNGGVQTCHQVASSTTFDAMTCDGVTERDLNTFGVPFTSGSLTVTTMDLWAPLIQINHQATDLPADQMTAVDDTSAMSSTSATMTMSSIPSSTAATPTTPPAISSPAATQSTVQSDHRIPTGTKVGVACAPIVGALALLGFFFYRKWKKRYLYPPEHFMPTKSISPDPSEPRPFNTDTEAGGKVQNMAAFSTPIHESPYNADHNPHDFAAGEPGPVVITPFGYEQSENMAGSDGEADIYNNEHSAPTPRFNRSLADEDAGSLESPIDGTSPFRLKRGNTLKEKEKQLTADRETDSRRMSPLVRSNSLNSYGSKHSSKDEIRWEYPLQRENSFSRPRPKPRPKTATSSVYADDRASSVYSWNNAVAPLPETAKGVERSKSFSRPRPRRDQSEDTLVEGNGPRVVE